MAVRKPLVIVSGQFSELPVGDSLSTVELAVAPSGLIYVGNKLGIDGSAQISGNAGISTGVTAQASGNAALVVGTTALSSGNAGISTGLTALASGNAGISSAILKLPLSGGTLTGDLTLNAQSDLRFADGDSSNYIAIQAPSTVSSNVTLTLPASDGTNGQVLSTNGTGTLSFATVGGGGITTIASGSFPAAATLDITGIVQTYAYLVLQYTGVSCTAGPLFFLVQASTDNGVSFDTTAGNYPSELMKTGTVTEPTAATMVRYAAQQAGDLTEGVLVITGYQAGPHAKFSSRLSEGTAAAELLGSYRSTSGINALRFLLSAAGNFDAGTYALYGVS